MRLTINCYFLLYSGLYSCKKMCTNKYIFIILLYLRRATRGRNKLNSRSTDFATNCIQNIHIYVCIWLYICMFVHTQTTTYIFRFTNIRRSISCSKSLVDTRWFTVIEFVTPLSHPSFPQDDEDVLLLLLVLRSSGPVPSPTVS